MKTISFIALFALAIPELSTARLGESLAEARSRYGAEVSSGGAQALNTTYTAIFKKNGIIIELTFAEYGRGETEAIEVTYTKNSDSKWTDDELMYLFKSNAQDSEWGEQKSGFMIYTWTRSDGGRAIFSPRKQSLTITSGKAFKTNTGGTPDGLDGF